MAFSNQQGDNNNQEPRDVAGCEQCKKYCCWTDILCVIRDTPMNAAVDFDDFMSAMIRAQRCIKNLVIGRDCYNYVCEKIKEAGDRKLVTDQKAKTIIECVQCALSWATYVEWIKYEGGTQHRKQLYEDKVPQHRSNANDRKYERLLKQAKIDMEHEIAEAKLLLEEKGICCLKPSTPCEDGNHIEPFYSSITTSSPAKYQTYSCGICSTATHSGCKCGQSKLY